VAATKSGTSRAKPIIQPHQQRCVTTLGNGPVRNNRAAAGSSGCPIEQAFAKLKALLRKATARTREALWTTIGGLLDTFVPAECRNYLANSGYASE
jgi:hypothetical protein